MTQSMPELDEKLKSLFERRREAGVVDVKCHVEVTAATSFVAVKKALANVLSKEESQPLRAYSAHELGSFDGLLAKI